MHYFVSMTSPTLDTQTNTEPLVSVMLSSRDRGSFGTERRSGNGKEREGKPRGLSRQFLRENKTIRIDIWNEVWIFKRPIFRGSMREHARFAKCDATIALEFQRSVLLTGVLRSKSMLSEATCNFHKFSLKSGLLWY